MLRFAYTPRARRYVFTGWSIARAEFPPGVRPSASSGADSAAQSGYLQKSTNFATNPERRVKNCPGTEAFALMHWHLKQRFPLVVVALVVSVGSTAGRAQAQLPRIDPTGESLFIWPDAPVVAAPASTPIMGPAPMASPPVVVAPAPVAYQPGPAMVPS